MTVFWAQTDKKNMSRERDSHGKKKKKTWRKGAREREGHGKGISHKAASFFKLPTQHQNELGVCDSVCVCGSVDACVCVCMGGGVFVHEPLRMTDNCIPRVHCVTE